MRSVSRSRPARVAIAVPALLLALAACGGQTTQGQAKSGPGVGAAVSTAASSAQVKRLDEKTFLPTVKAAVERQKSVHVSMRSTGQTPLKAEADVAMHGKGKRPDMATTVNGAVFGSGDLEVRVVGGTAYVSAPPMTPKGKFVEVRPGDRSSPFGGMGWKNGGMNGMDPRHDFDGWRSGLRKVTYLGEDSVQGKKAQHYRVTVDLRSARRDLPQMSQEMRGGPRAATYDVWLDSRALPLRVQLRSMPHVSSTVDMSHWGEAVTIQRPSPDQIMTYPSR